MTTPVELARELSARLQEASARCDESLRVVKQHENLGIVQVYGRLVGEFLGHSYTNVLAVLWAQHPELEPEGMKVEYEEPIPSLTDESRQAIQAFLDAVRPAIELAATLASTSNALPYGGVPEVASSVAEIEHFLSSPRFRDAK